MGEEISEERRELAFLKHSVKTGLEAWFSRAY